MTEDQIIPSEALTPTDDSFQQAENHGPIWSDKDNRFD